VILSTPKSDQGVSTQRWNIKKANWDTFKQLCQDRLNYEQIGSSRDSVENFSSTLLGIAQETIPKTSKHPHQKLHPGLTTLAKWRWLNEKKVWRNLLKNPPT